MMNSLACRAGLVGAASLLLTACGDKVEEQLPSYYVGFAQPFPGRGADKAAFPARHQGVYTAPDSTTSLGVGPTAVWRQELRQETYRRPQLDSLPQRVRADSTYEDLVGRRHYLRVFGRGDVRDSWLQRDTLFSLTGPNAGRLRRFQGRYYLSTHSADLDCWQVQRLEIAGRRLVWQRLGQDTLRLRVLDTATVRVRRTPGLALFLLQPAPGRQMCHVGDYAGLWTTEATFERRH